MWQERAPPKMNSLTLTRRLVFGQKVFFVKSKLKLNYEPNPISSTMCWTNKMPHCQISSQMWKTFLVRLLLIPCPLFLYSSQIVYALRHRLFLKFNLITEIRWYILLFSCSFFPLCSSLFERVEPNNVRFVCVCQILNAESATQAPCVVNENATQ